MTHTALNYFGIVLSLFTATGVLVHDARIDKAYTATASVQKRLTTANTTDAGLSSDAHTHPSQTPHSLAGFLYQSPAMLPRDKKSRRHLMQNIVPRGRHAFDNDNLPLVS